MNAVENEMSQGVSLKEQIKKRWMYQFCKDNLPAANLVEARPVSPMRTANAPGGGDKEDVEISVHTQENTGKTGKNSADKDASETDSNTDTEKVDTDASDDEADSTGGGAKIDPGGANAFDSETIVEDKEDQSIRVCIGYEFSKLQGPAPSTYKKMTAATRNSRREKSVLRVNTLNHRLATVLSAATRQTCLLDYAAICNYLLLYVEGITRVFTHRVHSHRNIFKIDTVVWQASQSAQELEDFDAHGQIKSIENSSREITTEMYSDVGHQWIRRQYSMVEDPKTVWMRQNALCAYCDVVTTPPDGEGVGTCCLDTMNTVVALSDATKLRRMKQEANTEPGCLLFDRILHPNRSVFVCTGCAQAYGNITGGTRAGFSHSDLPQFPTCMDNDHLFCYFSACSGLLGVFSVFVCVLDILCADQSHVLNDEPFVTIMAYATNIRDSELVYVNVAVSRFSPLSLQQFRTGFTVHNSNFRNTELQSVRETATLATDSFTSSRCHIFSCIYEHRPRDYVDFLNITHKSAFAGRLFVHLCKCMVTSTMHVRAADSGEALWMLLSGRTHDTFRRQTILSPDDHFFDGSGIISNSFRERSVLVSRRQIRLSNAKHPEMPQQGMSNLEIEHYSSVPIIDSIVLLQSFWPDNLLTLRQNKTHYHLYRLVAVYEMESRCTHWLDTANWNHVKNMPIVDATVLQWHSTFLAHTHIDLHRQQSFSFVHLKTRLESDVPDNTTQHTSALCTARFVCFYQRLTPNRGLYNAAPITLSSPLARNRCKLFRAMFGQDAATNPIVRMSKRAAHSISESPERVFHAATQEYMRMMAMAVRLLGSIILHEIHASLQEHLIDPREFNLFLYLFWNKFVISEGFHAQSESIRAGMLLRHAVLDFGNIDVHAALSRFRSYVAAQCEHLQDTRSESIRPVFADAKTLFVSFGRMLKSQSKCTSTAHAIRILSLYESRIALDKNEQVYALGNTKLMLHYLSRALDLTALQQYLSDIRDTLV